MPPIATTRRSARLPLALGCVLALSVDATVRAQTAPPDAGANRAPVVTIHVAGNRSFLWDDVPLRYLAVASDAEDGDTLAGTIDPDTVGVLFEPVPANGQIAPPPAVASTTLEAMLPGKRLVAGSDCIICHTVTGERNIPTYDKIAAVYEGEGDVLERLAEKIVRGGKGTWGDVEMPAHPDVTLDDARAMARYVLALTNDTALRDWRPALGSIVADHDAAGPAPDPFGLRSNLRYALSAVYTDRGAPPRSGSAALVLRPPALLAVERSAERWMAMVSLTGGRTFAVARRQRAHLAFGPVDLTGIRQIGFVVGDSRERWAGGSIELRLDSPVARPIARVEIVSDSPDLRIRSDAATLPPTRGFHTLYLVFRGAVGGREGSVALGAVTFDR